MSEVKRLVSDSTDEEVTQKNEKYFDCYLYGAKYYCSENRANKLGIVFDFCEKSSASGISTMPRRRTAIESAAASIDDRKINDTHDLPGPTEITKAASVTTTNFEKKHIAGKAKAHGKHQLISNLRSIPHRNGFISIQGEGDCNGFYVDGQSKEQQNQLKHLFLRIYEKNKRIKLVQDCNRLHWPKVKGINLVQDLSRALSPKLYNSIPFFIVLMEFLFDNMKKDTSHFNYMSVMESIHCLLLFKNYHKQDNRKRDNDSSDVEFTHCNLLLNKKLLKLKNETQDYDITWPEVMFSFAFPFVTVFVQGFT